MLLSMYFRERTLAASLKPIYVVLNVHAEPGISASARSRPH